MLLTVTVGISHAAHIDPSHPAARYGLGGFGCIVSVERPERGEIVHYPVGYQTEAYAPSYAAVCPHQTVDGIIHGAVSATDDNSVIAVGYHHIE